jgi:3-hydroxybutyryl-CoA dehydrogenase
MLRRKKSKDNAMEIRSIGIIGAGQMGNGIAHVTALAGYRVVMMDISQDSLTAALSLIEKNL